MIIAISNQKGGVGKTTTATNLAYGLQMMGKKVLLIDSDPQSNSSSTWRADVSDGNATLSDLLFFNEPWENCIQHTEIGDIIAADDVLDEASVRLNSVAGYFRLKYRLEPLKSVYDYIIIDTPPNLGILLQNALIAADGVITPITTSQFALDGMGKFIQTVNDVKMETNPKLEVLGLLFTKYDKRKLLAKDVKDELPDVMAELGTGIFETTIRIDEAIEQSQAAQMPVEMYAPKARATEDYIKFTQEVLNYGKERTERK